MSPKVPIDPFPFEMAWPFGGLSDETSHDDQPPLTSRYLQNVRGEDRSSGSRQGAKREGRAKQNGSVIDNVYGVRELGSVTFSQKTIDYSLDPGVEWERATPGNSDCLAGEVDADGNLYALSGDASISKFSPGGTEIEVFPLPGPSGVKVRTLDVDEGGNVYCGVSGGRGANEPANGLILGEVDDARIWKVRNAFRDNDEESAPEMEVAWELSTDPEEAGPVVRGLVGFVRVRGGKLYTIQHDNRRWRSYVVVYDGLGAGIPFESFAQEVPYPASSIDVNKNGTMAITCEAFSLRGRNPEHPENTGVIDHAWQLAKDLDEDIGATDDKHRPWIDLRMDPQYMVTTGGSTPEDGDEVSQWFDAFGSGRYVTFASSVGPSGKLPPRYKENGTGGKPCLVFDGSTQLMVSLESPTLAADFRDNQRGIFPAYGDPDFAVGVSERSAQYVAVALLRPEATDDGTTAVGNQFPVWDVPVTNPGGSVDDTSALIVNRRSKENLSDVGSTLKGAVTWYHETDSTDPGDGTSANNMPAWVEPPAPSAFVNSANAMLVSIGACNGVDASAAQGDDTEFRSFLRFWGRPVDRFMMEPDTLKSVAPQYLGGSGQTIFQNFGLFRGELYRLAVLDRRDLDKVGTDSVCSHPLTPDASEGTMVGQVTIIAEGALSGGPTTNEGPLVFDSPPAGGTPATGKWYAESGVLKGLEITSTGSGYDPDTRPSVTTGPSTGTAGFTVVGASLLAGMDYPLGEKPTATLLEKIEAEFAYSHGLGHLLHPGGFYNVGRTSDSNDAGLYIWDSPHPYAHPEYDQNYNTTTGAGYNPDLGPAENADTAGIHRYLHKSEILILMENSGRLLSVKSHDGSGIGFGCRFGPDGDTLYTVGNSVSKDGSGLAATALASTVRKWTIDEDNNLMPGWDVEAGFAMLGPVCNIRVDGAGNVYVPSVGSATFLGEPGWFGSFTDSFTLAVLNSADGSVLHKYNYDGSAAGAATSASQGSYTIVLPRAIEKADLIPFTEDYESDVVDSSGAEINPVEFVYILGSKETYSGVPIGAAIRKYRLVSSSPNGDRSRLRHDLAVANGSVYRYDDGVPVLVTGGAAALNAAAGGVDYVHMAQIGQKLYGTDGAANIVYDPKTGEVETWASTHGTLPPNYRIVEMYRGRAVRTGGGDGSVHMSRVLNPENWDKDPPIATVEQACDFASTQVNDVPDVVTGFIPASDDEAVIGANESLWHLRGDPMEEGRLDRIPGSVGMAFGRAWCRGPGASLYFFGTNPAGLYVMDGPGAAPRDLSSRKIQKRLSAIDLGANYIRLAYDPTNRGVWIMVVPYAYPTDTPLTYFYELDRDAFYEDFVDDVGGTVTAILAVDGDEPNDRRVLTGHADGFVRYVDPEAASDDGVAIRAWARLGAFKSPIAGYEIRPLKLGVTLASAQNGLSWALYASDTPDVPGSPARQGSFKQGSNLFASCRALGSYFWLEFNQGTLSSRFALEKIVMQAEAAGIQRVRS